MIELFHFGAEGGADQPNSFLVNQEEYIWKLALYVKEKVFSDKNLSEIYSQRYMCDVPRLKSDKETFPEFTPKEYFLGGKFVDLSISQREMECLKKYFYGESSEQIGKKLFISK